MTTKKGNTTNYTASFLGSLLVLIFVSNIFGFLAWAAYQVAATNSLLLPAISLVAGLGFWNLWTFMTCVPLAFKVLFRAGVQADADAKYAEKLKNALELQTKNSTYVAIPPTYYDNKNNKNNLDS